MRGRRRKKRKPFRQVWRKGLAKPAKLQRQDLSAVEEVYAITELIDAEMIEDDAYSISATTALDRVKWLLGKLNADYANGTEHFIHKFMYKMVATTY